MTPVPGTRLGNAIVVLAGTLALTGGTAALAQDSTERQLSGGQSSGPLGPNPTFDECAQRAAEGKVRFKTLIYDRFQIDPGDGPQDLYDVNFRITEHLPSLDGCNGVRSTQTMGRIDGHRVTDKLITEGNAEIREVYKNKYTMSGGKKYGFKHAECKDDEYTPTVGVKRTYSEDGNVETFTDTIRDRKQRNIECDK